MNPIFFVLYFVFSISASAQTSQEKAFTIAEQGLLTNLVPCALDTNGNIERCVVAGAHQYHSFWARDFAWASAGVIVIGGAEAVRKSLEIELSLIDSNGLLPRGFDRLSNNWRFILGSLRFKVPFFGPFHGTYLSENNVIPLDTNSLIPWAGNLYVQMSKDRAFALKYFPAAAKSIEFLQSNYVVDGLIDQAPPFSDWEDSIRRTGKVAYTNAVFLMALRAMKDWATFLNLESEAKAYSAFADLTEKRFLEHFWQSDLKRLKNFDGDDHLTMDANLIAVVYELVPKDVAFQIMETLRASPLWQPIPGRVTFPNFPRAMKSFLPRLSGTGHYHDSQYWLWLSSLAARAEHKMQQQDACDNILSQISEVVLQSKGVQENYELTRNGQIKPFKRLLYRAEVPFTWSSGMFIEAMSEGCI